jgi:hypothetical protein
MATYNTALVVGRAFALANSDREEVDDPAGVLCRLAGDELTLRLAQDRFREFLARRPTVEDQRALDLLERAAAMRTDPAPCDATYRAPVLVG